MCSLPVYCTNPPAIPNARHDGIESRTRFEVNNTLTYTCEEGYSTVGFNVAKCFLYNNTMQWFGPEIVCQPRECGDPGEILNGFKEGSCHHYDCRVTYHCRPGFEMEGRNVYRCHQDGTWSPRELPNCKPIKCEVPENPRHGKATFSSYFYNAVVTYTCDYGYMIVGPETRRCGPDRQWSGTMPSCQEIDCGPPGVLHNGRLEGTFSTYNYGTEIKFYCSENMKYEGYHDRRTVCQKNGTWSNPLPKCLAPCVVPTIENGRLSNESQAGTLVPHGSIIRVMCNKTYEPSVASVPSACYNGTWTHYPHCEPARCKKLPRRPRNGMVIAPRTAHGMLARFRCRDGFRLMGPATTKCHFGSWAGRIPWCKIVYCPFPGYLPDGRVLLVGNMGMYIYRPYVKKVRNDRRIRFECNKGYFLSSGPPGATCIGGSWRPSTLPRCSPKLHPRVRWARSVNASDYIEHLNVSSEVEVVKEDEEEVLALEDAHNIPQEKGRGGEDTVASFSLSMEPSDLTQPAYYSDAPLRLSNESSISSTKTPLSSPAYTPLSELYFRAKKYTGNKRHFETWAKFIQEEHDGVEVSKILIREEEVAGGRREARHSSRISRSPKRQNEGASHLKVLLISSLAPHCEELADEPYLRLEVVRAGRDANFTFSAGARVKVTCLYGHGLNLGNKTAKCSRGRWRPMKPECISCEYRLPSTPGCLPPGCLLHPPAVSSTPPTVSSTPRLSPPPPGCLLHPPRLSPPPPRLSPPPPGCLLHPPTVSPTPPAVSSTPRLSPPLPAVSSTPRLSPPPPDCLPHPPRLSPSPGCLLHPPAVSSTPPTASPTPRLSPSPGCLLPGCLLLGWLSPSPTTHGRYTFNGVQVPERATIGHAEVVEFSCGRGYTVLGNPSLRCWYGEWTVTGTRPECQPVLHLPAHQEPCLLPEVTHGNYTAALYPGGHVAHGHQVDYACEDGWLVGIPRVTCHLGHLRPVPPACVTPAEATHPQDSLLTPLVRTASIMLSYGAGDLTPGRDITNIDFEAGVHPPCSPPARVQGTLIYKNGQPLHQAEQSNQSSCPAAPLRQVPPRYGGNLQLHRQLHRGENYLEIHCERGSWIGQRSTSPCAMLDGEDEGKITLEEEEPQEDLVIGNVTCMWRNAQVNVVTFLEDRELREEVMELPPGTELVFRCVDIGKFAFSGSSHRRCINGQWSGVRPDCLALNSEFDYALEKPPTILFRHKNGPIVQTNDGQLLVTPGTELYLECLWMRRYGTPRWNVTHTHP
ncbi:Protein lev-9 [Chionoecetes opilio]|uniref:Protein lev-9 n=1 Tax=Chionoecetes opilio TaxID=41210 RepID=A0A8J4YI87_CHIOP|nr:Protein lev-9 [Chionoecetes opilio]